MKSLALLSIALFIGVQSFAQDNSQSQERLTYFNRVEKFRKMKSTGTFLTVVGSIFEVVGIITAINSSTETYDDGYGNVTTTTHGHPIGAIFLLAGGHACLGSGLPLLIIGSKNQKKYQGKLDALTVSFKANPNATGLTLAYHF